MKKLALLLAAAMLLGPAAAFAQNPPAPAEAEPEWEFGPGPNPAADTEVFRSLLIRVNFEAGGMKPTPPSLAELDSVAALFKPNPLWRYEVHGHSCPDIGDQSSAMQFSIRRVAAIVNFLLKSGVPAANIVTIINPATGDAAAGECTHDRRVDIMSIETRKREPRPEPEPVAIPAPAPEPAAAPDPIAPPEPVRAGLKPAPTPDHAAAPDGKPTLAIYMAGEEPQKVRGVHNILGGELARTISESEKYLAVDRTDAILEVLSKEHVYQRSGAVSDEEIKTLGQQLGAQYLCISNINAAGKRSYYLDVRLVDVVTTEIMRTATATSDLKDANEMTRVARSIAFELIENEKAKERRARMKKIFRYTAIGLDIIGAGLLAYGYIENENIVRLVNEGEYPDAVRVAMRRNAAYMAGGVLLSSGVTLHVFF